MELKSVPKQYHKDQYFLNNILQGLDEYHVG